MTFDTLWSGHRLGQRFRLSQFWRGAGVLREDSHSLVAPFVLPGCGPDRRGRIRLGRSHQTVKDADPSSGDSLGAVSAGKRQQERQMLQVFITGTRDNDLAAKVLERLEKLIVPL